MRKIVYSDDFDDDTWRDVNFSEAELVAAQNVNARQPTADELIKAANKYGSEGILESAILLRQFEYKRVERAIAKLELDKRKKR